MGVDKYALRAKWNKLKLGFDGGSYGGKKANKVMVARVLESSGVYFW
jgi:hypothetical protein